MPDLATIAIAFLLGVVGGFAASDYLSKEDGVGVRSFIAGGMGGVVGSLALQFVFPPLSRFHDWLAIVSQVAAAFVSGGLLTVIVGVVARHWRWD
jgi:hypothetical protein